MEAKVDKKPTNGKFKSWKSRCWRIRDRRFIQYNSSCTKWEHCVTSKTKLDIDLAHMTAVSFYPKSSPKPNILYLKHPKIGDTKKQGQNGGLLLRFNTNNQRPGQDIMYSWLKVLTSWGVDRKQNRIYVAIPSNYSYGIWILLSALYKHPKLLTTQGIFRKESCTVRAKHILCNDILYEMVSLQDLFDTHNDIDLLAKSLQYLLCNLPCSIFGDANFEDLLCEIQLFADVKLISADEAKMLKDSELDNDIAHISYAQLLKLKTCIDRMYVGHKYQHRYGMISLILHLLKQTSLNVSINRTSCHSLARLFVMCFESKLYMQNMFNPFRSLLLIKILIFHSYFLFPVAKYKMSDIVIAEWNERATMHKYKTVKMSKKQKRNRLKQKLSLRACDAPTKYYNAEEYVWNMSDTIRIPKCEYYKEEQKEFESKASEIKHFKRRHESMSKDDLYIGTLERKEKDIVNLVGLDLILDRSDMNEKQNHFEAVHTRKQSRSLEKKYVIVISDVSDGDFGLIERTISDPIRHK